MRIAVLGGAFDPIHNGHLAILSTVLSQGFADEVYVILSRQHPPHKAPAVAPAEDRLAMCEVALDPVPHTRILTFETDNRTQGYTLETLAHLRQVLSPEAELSLVVGTDNFLMLHTWHNPRGVLALARLLVIGRDGQTPDVCQAYFESHFFPDWTAHVDWVSMPPVETSSTALRQAIRAGESVSAWLPPAVAAYIDTMGLYR